MMPRYARETQRAYVERVLRDERCIATYAVLYDLAYGDGQKCSITRLAAIICDLRAEGWNIATSETGPLAVYRLAAEPAQSQPPWRCLDCGTPAILSVHEVLGGMGQGRCDSCHTTRYFRRAA